MRKWLKAALALTMLLGIAVPAAAVEEDPGDSLANDGQLTEVASSNAGAPYAYAIKGNWHANMPWDAWNEIYIQGWAGIGHCYVTGARTCPDLFRVQMQLRASLCLWYPCDPTGWESTKTESVTYEFWVAMSNSKTRGGSTGIQCYNDHTDPDIRAVTQVRMRVFIPWNVQDWGAWTGWRTSAHTDFNCWT